MRAPAIVLTLSTAFLALSLGGLYLGDKVLDETFIAMPTGSGSLGARFHKGSAHPAWGVVIFHGLGRDMTAMRPLARELAARGATVLSLDFPGHGSSPGGFAYDTGDSASLAQLAAVAFQSLCVLGDLQPSRAAMLGQGIGADAALRAAAMGLASPGCLVLLGPRASSIPGTDGSPAAWELVLSACNPPIPISIAAGMEEGATRPGPGGDLFKALSAGGPGLSPAPRRRFANFPSVPGDYLSIAPPAAAFALEELASAFSLAPAASPSSFLPWRILFWAVGFASLCAALASFPRALSRPGPQPEEPAPSSEGPGPAAILATGYALWAPALAAAAGLVALLSLIPLPGPSSQILSSGLVAGYGLVGLLALVAARRSYPGFGAETLPPATGAEEARKKRMSTILFATVLLVSLRLYADSGWFRLFPLNARLAWLVVLGPLCGLGFRASSIAARALSVSKGGRAMRLLLDLCLYAPFLVMGACEALGLSAPSCAGSVQVLLCLALASLTGPCFRALGASGWGTALGQGLLFHYLLLPVGALVPP